jgi:high-affinity nickel-transport protein
MPARRGVLGVIGKGHRPQSAALGLCLLLANLLLWLAALLLFRHYPVLLGTALLAYSFGLRHAVDADHIAAIDNATRKLMAQGQRPLFLGLYFSLGHSTIVFLLSAAVAGTAAAMKTRLATLAGAGDVIGTLISALFLLAIAAVNLAILINVIATFRRIRAGAAYRDGELNALLAQRGFFARLFRALFQLVTRGWHMYVIGLLFGLGFDTATEVGLLGISATQAAHGLPVWSIMIFPALFAAAMALIDTADSLLMLHAYGWAETRPMRKLFYNITVTAVSVLVALVIGGLELLGLVQTRNNLSGLFWDIIATLNTHFGMLGYIIIAIFAASWAISATLYKANRYDDVAVRVE